MSFSLRNRNKKELTLAPSHSAASPPSSADMLSPLFTPADPDDEPSTTESSSSTGLTLQSSSNPYHLPTRSSTLSPPTQALLHPSPRGYELSLGSPFRFDPEPSLLSDDDLRQQHQPAEELAPLAPPPSEPSTSSFPSSPRSQEADGDMMARPLRSHALQPADGTHADQTGPSPSHPSSSLDSQTHDVSGVGRMGNRKVGGSWTTGRPASQGDGADRQGRPTRQAYAHLSAAASSSSSTSTLTPSSNVHSPSHPTTPSSTYQASGVRPSPFPPGGPDGGYPQPTTDGRPFGGHRSFSSTNVPAGGWTPPQQTATSSAYGQPYQQQQHHQHPHSVPSHPHAYSHPAHHAPYGSESVPAHQHGSYYSSQHPHDPYGSASGYELPPAPPPSSYHPHPLTYHADGQHHAPLPPPDGPYSRPLSPQPRPTSSSRPPMPSRAKSTNDAHTRSGRSSLSSSASTLRKKKSSVAMASSYTHAGAFPASPRPSMPNSRLPSPEGPSTTACSSSSSTLTLNDDKPGPEQAPKPSSPKKHHGPARTEGHVSRPPNSWILYRSHTIKLMTEAKEKDVDPPIPASVCDHPAAVNLDRNMRHQADMSTLISVMWKCESDEVKKKYAKLSQIAKAEHQAANPGYKYKPVRKGGAVAATTFALAPGSPRNKHPIHLPAARAFHAAPPPPASRKAPRKKAKSSASRKQIGAPGSGDDDAIMDGEQGWTIPLPANVLEGLQPAERYEAVARNIQEGMAGRIELGDGGEGEWVEYEHDSFATDESGLPTDPDAMLSGVQYPNRTFDPSYIPPSTGFHPSQLASASSYDFAQPQPVTYDLGPLDTSSSIYPAYPEDATNTASTDFTTFEEYPPYNAEAGPSTYANLLHAPALFSGGLGSAGLESPLVDDDPNHYAAMWCLLDEDPSGMAGGEQAVAPFDMPDASQWTDGTWDVIGEGGLAVPIDYDGYGHGDEGGGAGFAGEMVMVGSEGGMTVSEMVRQQWENDRRGGAQIAPADDNQLQAQEDNSFEYEYEPNNGGADEVTYLDAAGDPANSLQWVDTDQHQQSFHPQPQDGGYLGPGQPQYQQQQQQLYASGSSSASSRKRYRAPPTPTADQLTFPDSHAPSLAPPLPLDAQPGYLRLKTSSGQLRRQAQPQQPQVQDPRWAMSYEQQHHAHYHPAPPPQQQQEWSLAANGPQWQINPPSPPQSAPLGETQPASYYYDQDAQDHTTPTQSSSTTYNPYASMSQSTTTETEIFSPPVMPLRSRSTSVERLGDEHEHEGGAGMVGALVFDEPVEVGGSEGGFGRAGGGSGGAKAGPRRGGRVVGGSYKA